MRTLVHLSDLHFGRVDQTLLDPLVDCICGLNADLLVVSGDLTQRARTSEFEAARAFLDRLPLPRVVVPGNHDVPLYNVFARLLTPLRKYRRIIDPDLAPSFVDAEIAVLGVNTARSLVVKDGRINHQQVRQLRQRLDALPPHMVRVVVTHHPFDVHEGGDDDDVVGRARMAMRAFEEGRVDLLLAGHVHVSHTSGSDARYATPGHRSLIVSAGTATSTRGRGESNSFNVLRVEARRVEIERRVWRPADRDFGSVGRQRFERGSGGWHAAAA